MSFWFFFPNKYYTNQTTSYLPPSIFESIDWLLFSIYHVHPYRLICYTQSFINCDTLLYLYSIPYLFGFYKIRYFFSQHEFNLTDICIFFQIQYVFLKLDWVRYNFTNTIDPTQSQISIYD